MENQLPLPITVLIWIHILGGSIALATFVIPLLARKGGKLHARSGWVYASAMIVVSISTFLITPWRFFWDSSADEYSQDFAFFLFFISLFAITMLLQGLVILRHKERISSIRSLSTWGLPVVLFLFSVFAFTYATEAETALFYIFPSLAVVASVKQINFWRKPPKHPKSWWPFHLENMVTCCIATVTAFNVTALPRIFPSLTSDDTWVWIAPSLIMVPWMRWTIRSYEKKFAIAKKNKN